MIFILLSVFLLPFVSSANCPEGSQWSADYNSCYLVTTKGAHWTGAEGICRYLGGHLAAVRSKEHNDYLWSISHALKLKKVWIGANTVNGVWTNSDGTPANYTNIMPDNPLNHTHNVAALTANGWTVENDEERVFYGFICELSPCPSDGSQPPSLLDINDKSTGLFYGDMSNSWYYGKSYIEAGFENGQKHCQSVKGNLPSIHNAFQNSQFQEIIDQLHVAKEISLGLAIDKVGNWTWMDGSPFNYHKWGMGEPGFYTHFTTYDTCDQTWYAENTEFGTNTPNYICQFSLDNRKIC